jgi:hypothetical protein
MAYLSFGCRCLLLVVFAVAALGKVRGGDRVTAFRRATADLMPAAARRHAGHLAVAVVGAELIVAVLLAVPVTAAAGLAAGLALLAAFTVAVTAALRRGGSAPCHCFGTRAGRLGARHVVRNAILLLVAATGLLSELANPGAPTEPLGLVLAGATAAVLALLVLSFDPLVELFREGITS